MAWPVWQQGFLYILKKEVWQQDAGNETNPCVFFKSQVGWFPSNYTQEEIDDPHTYCMAENVLDVMVKLKLPKQLPSGIVIPIADSNFAGGALCIQGPGRH